MNTLETMCVSHVQSVVLAEEKLLESRSRVVESYQPKLVPRTLITKTAVFAPIDVPPPEIVAAGVNMKEALKAVTALFSIVRANF
jgi:hypothetical protein